MSLLALLTDTCSVLRKTETQSTTTGGLSAAWASLSTGNPCSIQVAGGSEQYRQGREASVDEYTGYFDYSIDLRFGDRIVWTPQDSPVAYTLEVVGDPGDGCGRQAYQSATLRSVTGGGTT